MGFDDSFEKRTSSESLRDTKELPNPAEPILNNLSDSTKQLVEQAERSGGDKAVAIIQAFMKQVGIDRGMNNLPEVDGILGNQTKEAIMRFYGLIQSDDTIRQNFSLLPIGFKEKILGIGPGNTPIESSYMTVSPEKRSFLASAMREYGSLVDGNDASLQMQVLAMLTKAMYFGSPEHIKNLQIHINSNLGKELTECFNLKKISNPRLSEDGILGDEVFEIINQLCFNISNESQSQKQQVPGVNNEKVSSSQEALLPTIPVGIMPEGAEYHGWEDFKGGVMATYSFLEGGVQGGYTVAEETIQLVPKYFSGELRKEVGEALKGLGEVASVIYEGVRKDEIGLEQFSLMTTAMLEKMKGNLADISKLPPNEQSREMGKLSGEALATCFGGKWAISAIKELPRMLVLIKGLPKEEGYRKIKELFQEGLKTAKEHTQLQGVAPEGVRVDIPREIPNIDRLQFARESRSFESFGEAQRVQKIMNHFNIESTAEEVSKDIGDIDKFLKELNLAKQEKNVKKEKALLEKLGSLNTMDTNIKHLSEWVDIMDVNEKSVKNLERILAKLNPFLEDNIPLIKGTPMYDEIRRNVASLRKGLVLIKDDSKLINLENKNFITEKEGFDKLYNRIITPNFK